VKKAAFRSEGRNKRPVRARLLAKNSVSDQGRSKGRAAGAAALRVKNIKGTNLGILIPILNPNQD